MKKRFKKIEIKFGIIILKLFRKKRRAAEIGFCRSLLGGGYLLSHFRSTIGVVRLNFSVRNGKRWIPHAITTLMRLRPLPFVFTALCSSGDRVFSEMHRRTSREWLFLFLDNFYFHCLFSSGADSFEGLRRGGRLVFATFPPFLLFLFSDLRP